MGCICQYGMAQFLAGGYSRANNLGTRTGYSLLEAIHNVERNPYEGPLAGRGTPMFTAVSRRLWSELLQQRR